nr:uncharacterized protein CTRU02_07028 [Colletotrichum truncatum]KAF6791844.1 hypothetical protein CTRU02_07028 [Colletotrichum truncatum]
MVPSKGTHSQVSLFLLLQLLSSATNPDDWVGAYRLRTCTTEARLLQIPIHLLHHSLTNDLSSGVGPEDTEQHRVSAPHPHRGARHPRLPLGPARISPDQSRRSVRQM